MSDKTSFHTEATAFAKANHYSIFVIRYYIVLC